MYLRLQLNAIDGTLSQLSNSTFYLDEAPFMDYQELCRPLVENDFLVGDRKVLHQRVVKRTGGKSIYFENEVPEIQSVLRTDTGSISIQEGAWEMVNLSIALHRLDMFEEAATIGLWTVKLFRTLVSADSKIYMPYLFHALRHLAAFYTDIDKSPLLILLKRV